MCTVDREPVFGAIVARHLRLNAIGSVVADTWRWLTVQYPYVTLDEWCVMPDHLHGILVLGGLPTDMGGSRAAVGGSRAAPTGDGATTNVDADAAGARPRLDGPRSNGGGSRTDVGASRAAVGGSRAAPTGDGATTNVDAAILRRKPLGELIGAFKTVSTKRINALRNTPGALVWQRDFWDHIVRDETDLHRIRGYIQDNGHL